MLFFTGCVQNQSKNLNPSGKSLASVPAWAKEAIWYQIFVERFRNGDLGNDPTPADMYGSYPEKIPDNWKITPWGHDWYSHEPWLDSVKAKDSIQKYRPVVTEVICREYLMRWIIFNHLESLQSILIP